MHPLSLLRRTAFAAALVLVPALSHAGTILETASFTGNDPGDYIVVGDGTNDNSRFIGAAFTLNTATHITDVGFGAGRYGSGTLFAAIVPLAAGGFPAVEPADLAGITLGSTLISVPSGIADAAGLLPLDLAAGSYGIVFGSGLFGASGVGPFTSGNATIGNPVLFQSLYGADWLRQSADGIRIFVNGEAVSAAVPEPDSIALVLAGLLGAGLFMGRRRNGSGLAAA